MPRRAVVVGAFGVLDAFMGGNGALHSNDVVFKRAQFGVLAEVADKLDFVFHDCYNC